MAITNPAFGETYGNPSIREDLTDIIFQITPTDTPVMNIMSRGKCNSTIHQWQTRALVTRTDNAVQEGAVYDFALNASFTAHTPQARRAARATNITQSFLKQIRVSTTSEAVDQAGISSMMADQAQVKTVEMKTDMEHAGIQGTLASGASDGVPRFSGLIEGIETGDTATTYTTGTGAVTMVESLLNDQIQLCWENGGAPRDWFMFGKMKRAVSAFTASSQPYINADEQRVVNTISVYESDFFIIEVKLSRDIPNGTGHANGVLGLDRTMLEFCMLRPVTLERTAKIASSTDAVIEAEGCPAWGNPSGHFYGAQVESGLN